MFSASFHLNRFYPVVQHIVGYYWWNSLSNHKEGFKFLFSVVYPHSFVLCSLFFSKIMVFYSLLKRVWCYKFWFNRFSLTQRSGITRNTKQRPSRVFTGGFVGRTWYLSTLSPRVHENIYHQLSIVIKLINRETILLRSTKFGLIW